MTFAWPESPIGDVAEPIERPEVPIPGRTFRQIGVRLWEGGVYERESLEGGRTQYAKLNRVEVGDIIVNKIWARNGSVAVVPEILSGCYCSTEFPLFRPKPDRLDPRWFYWITKTPWFWERCDIQSRGTSGKNRVQPEKFLAIPIPLPPLQEQRRIVARIEELATKIEEARGLRRRAAIEAEALLKSQVAVTVNELVKRFGSRPLGQVILEASYGTSAKCNQERPKGSLPVLRIPNVASERVNLDAMKYGTLSSTESQRVLVTEGDVLVVRTNGSADLVGRCAVVPAFPEPTAFASYLIRLRCDPKTIIPEYLQLILKHLRTGGELIDFARTTAGQYNVSLGRLRAAPLPVPSLAAQRQIVALLNELQKQVEALKQLQAETAAELDALLPSILDKAFKGEF